jgi:hypothetical protein
MCLCWGLWPAHKGLRQHHRLKPFWSHWQSNHSQKWAETYLKENKEICKGLEQTPMLSSTVEYSLRPFSRSFLASQNSVELSTSGVTTGKQWTM